MKKRRYWGSGGIFSFKVLITFEGQKCISPFKKVIILIGFTAVSLIIPLQNGDVGNSDLKTLKGNILRELAKGSAKEGFFSLP